MVAKMPFWVNLGEKLKKLFAFLKSAPSNLSKVIVHVKQKNFEFRTKMPNLGTFIPKFEQSIIIFEISSFEFVKLRSFIFKK